jgi:hypothetical protein
VRTRGEPPVHDIRRRLLRAPNHAADAPSGATRRRERWLRKLVRSGALPPGSPTLLRAAKDPDTGEWYGPKEDREKWLADHRRAWLPAMERRDAARGATA